MPWQKRQAAVLRLDSSAAAGSPQARRGAHEQARRRKRGVTHEMQTRFNFSLRFDLRTIVTLSVDAHACWPHWQVKSSVTNLGASLFRTHATRGPTMETRSGSPSYDKTVAALATSYWQRRINKCFALSVRLSKHNRDVHDFETCSLTFKLLPAYRFLHLCMLAAFGARGG